MCTGSLDDTQTNPHGNGGDVQMGHERITIEGRRWIAIAKYATSRPEANRADDQERKTALVPKLTQVVCVELHVEAMVEYDGHGKLILWLQGCRPAARSGEVRHSGYWKPWASRGFFFLRGKGSVSLLDGAQKLMHLT